MGAAVAPASRVLPCQAVNQDPQAAPSLTPYPLVAIHSQRESPVL